METIYYLAASADGFIATPDGDVGWLDQLGIDPENSGYPEFFAGVDGLLLGRTTYDQVLGFGEWPYGTRPCWVSSHRPVQSPDSITLQAEQDPVAAVAAATRMGLQRLWLVGGGKLARALLEADLLTHFSLVQVPVLLGEGIPVFARMPRLTLMTLLSVTEFERGLVQLDYRLQDRGLDQQE